MKRDLTLQVPILLLAFLIIANNVLFAQLQSEPARGLMAGQPVTPAKSAEPGLLFYLSGDKQFTADFAAGGQTSPNFLRDVKTVANGAYGAGFECADNQLMSYWSPGNIYAQRGTLSFFWRSRYPVGPS